MKIKSFAEDGIPIGPWRLTFWGNEQWSCFFKRNCNWYDFTVIEATFERASYTGRYIEGTFGLVGIKFGFEIFHMKERELMFVKFNEMIDESRLTRLDSFPEED